MALTVFHGKVRKQNDKRSRFLYNLCVNGDITPLSLSHTQWGGLYKDEDKSYEVLQIYSCSKFYN